MHDQKDSLQQISIHHVAGCLNLSFSSSVVGLPWRIRRWVATSQQPRTGNIGKLVVVREKAKQKEAMPEARFEAFIDALHMGVRV
ncbi:hypothetical protein C1H46_001762 [Malus baccata]|uniref:Uncharacterized protein n=1 Tax=Malus baccata TaxID=106549 RepID=A0A540NPV6_MALBA|nr:hypothetical protein C1H46_001762 [Malus baccata]